MTTHLPHALWLGTVAGLAAGIFALDRWLPLGMAVPVLYTAPVVLSLWLPGRGITVLIGLGVSILTLVDLWLSWGEIGYPPGAANRALGLGAIWVAAALLVLHKDALASLRRSEEELSDFFQHAAIGTHWVGPDGIILRANQAELNMLDYTVDEYVGRHIAEFHVDAEVIEDILGRLRRHENLQEYPARLRRKDGVILDVLISSNVRWEGHRFVHARCFARDITDSKRMQEVQAKLAAIVNSSDDAIIGKDLDGNVTSWNEGAERVFGYAAEEMIGRPITTLIPPDLLEEETGIIGRVREGERIQDFETVRFRKDSRRIHVSLTVSPIKAADGGIIGVSKIARDITQRKEAEKERERLLGELREALDHIKTLRGMLPICASCKNVRNDQGYWDHIENYIQEHSEARVTHGICPECCRKLYPHLMDKTAATPTNRLPPKP